MLLERLTRWLEKRGSSRMIRRADRETGVEHDYLLRFYIFRVKWFSIFLHQFWASDPDHVHDHPWDNFTWLIKGGYWEFEADGTCKWQTKGFRRFRRAEQFHRLAIGEHAGGEAWSIFFHFKRRRNWGFWTPEGWLEATEYGEKYGAPVETQNSNDYKIVGMFFPKVVWIND